MIPLVISLNVTDYWVRVVFDLSVTVIIFGWFLLVGKNLNDELSDGERKPDLLFTINCFYLITLSSLSSILNVGNDTEKDMPLFVLVMVIYFVIAFFQVSYFASNAFLSVQNINPKKPDHYGSQSIFFFFLFFVIGVWFIQPRVNQYFEKSH